MKKNKILIIDGSNLFVRAFNCLSDEPLQNSKGQATTAIFVFLKTLRSIIKSENPKEVFVVFDQGRDTRKKTLYPEYKANRGINLSDFSGTSFDPCCMSFLDENESRKRQLEVIKKALDALPIKTISVLQVEADNIISFLAINRSSDPNSSIVVYSADKDFMQLLTIPNVSILSPTYKKKINRDNFKIVSKSDVITPNEWRIYKCIKGDISDNIKGINGIGDKKIESLFKQLKDGGFKFSSLSEFYNSIEKIEIKGITRKLLDQENRYIMEKNYSIIDLMDSSFSPRTLSIVFEAIEKKISISEIKLFQVLMQENLNSFIMKSGEFLHPFYCILGSNLDSLAQQRKKTDIFGL